MAAASFGVIGTRRHFFPLAPAAQRTRSSSRFRCMQSSMRVPPIAVEFISPAAGPLCYARAAS